eukprot:480932-Rhodomonas_salina.1
MVTEYEILTKALLPLPDKFKGLTDINTRPSPASPSSNCPILLPCTAPSSSLSHPSSPISQPFCAVPCCI